MMGPVAQLGRRVASTATRCSNLVLEARKVVPSPVWQTASFGSMSSPVVAGTASSGANSNHRNRLLSFNDAIVTDVSYNGMKSQQRRFSSTPLPVPEFGEEKESTPPVTIASDVNDDGPLPNTEEMIRLMTDEKLRDNSTIPGWHLIHSPPRTFPRGALVGFVVSDKMDKTVNVQVARYKLTPKVRKRISYKRKFFAHDEKEVANVGDLVMITPCHRMSKHKHFMLREIIRPKGVMY